MSMRERAQGALTGARVFGRDVLEVASGEGFMREYIMTLEPKSYVTAGRSTDQAPSTELLPMYYHGGTFDAVIDLELEREEYWVGAMSGLIRVLRPQGYLVVAARRSGPWRYTSQQLDLILSDAKLIVDRCTETKSGVFAFAHKPYGWEWDKVIERWDYIKLERADA